MSAFQHPIRSRHSRRSELLCTLFSLATHRLRRAATISWANYCSTLLNIHGAIQKRRSAGWGKSACVFASSFGETQEAAFWFTSHLVRLLFSLPVAVPTVVILAAYRSLASRACPPTHPSQVSWLRASYRRVSRGTAVPTLHPGLQVLRSLRRIEVHKLHSASDRDHDRDATHGSSTSFSRKH